MMAPSDTTTPTTDIPAAPVPVDAEADSAVVTDTDTGAEVDATGEAPEVPREVVSKVVTSAMLDEKLREWVTSHIHGSAVSRSTEAYNHLVAVLPALRNIIMRES